MYGIAQNTLRNVSRQEFIVGWVRILYGTLYLVPLCDQRQAKRPIVISWQFGNPATLAIAAWHKVFPSPIKATRLATGADAQNALATVRSPTLSRAFQARGDENFEACIVLHLLKD